MKSINSIEELFLKTKEELEGKHGSISINFANKNHVYYGNDIIGNCLQEWLPNWFSFLGVDIKSGEHTQKFPDFIAKFQNIQYDIEVKAWNINNAPAFDIANFDSFLTSTFESPGKLEARYFILGYSPVNDGFSQGFIVKKVYLKHLWEITNSSRIYPIGLQVKNKRPYAIRPCNFYKFEERHFNDKNSFIEAIAKTFELFKNPNLGFTIKEWKDKVLSY